MNVKIKIDRKTLILAKAISLQAAENEEQEKKIVEAFSKCDADTTIELNAEEIGVKEAKQLSLALALIAVSKIV